MEIYNISKAVYHTDRIKSLQLNKPISPTLLQVDLEAYCNDNCNFCSYRKEEGYNDTMLKLISGENDDRNQNRPIGKPTKESGLPAEFALLLPKMLKEGGIPAIELTGGGEPTIWKYFDTLLDDLVKNNIEIGLVTNGSTLPDSRIEKLARHATWIRFSMDSSNEITHQKIHRTPNLDFDRRIQNIKKIVAKKKEFDSQITIGISFIINQLNKDDVVEAAKFYSTMGVDNIRFSWMFDKTGTAGLTIDEIDGLKKALDVTKKTFETDSYKIFYEKDRIDSFSQPNDDFKTCYMQRFVWALGADCKIYPCCIMKYHEKFALGDIRQNTLLELVQLSHSKMNGLDPQGCFPCWLRSRNKAIGQAVEKPKHHNFV